MSSDVCRVTVSPGGPKYNPAARTPLHVREREARRGPVALHNRFIEKEKNNQAVSVGHLVRRGLLGGRGGVCCCLMSMAHFQIRPKNGRQPAG